MRTGGKASRARWQAGAAGIEYAGLIGVAIVITLFIGAVAVPSTVKPKAAAAICEIFKPGDPCAEAKPPGSDPTGGPSPDPTVTPDDRDAAFQPDKCIVNSESTKSKTQVRILFIKISSSSEVKIVQWSDGTVTMEATGSVAGGLEAALDIPGLSKWNGSASITGGFTKGSGSGSRWMFDKNRTGDPQKDLEANYRDAQQFVEYLKKAQECRSKSGPRAAELGMICSYHNNKDNMPELPPDEMPDYDISRTTTEKVGDLKLGGKFKKNDKPLGNGALQAKGLAGTIMNDVLVLRGNGEITFVYTVEVSGRVGAGFQGEGSHMEQIYVTYNAEDYDKEEKEGKEHRPIRLRLITAERAFSGNGGVDGKIQTQAGPFNIAVEGGGGSVDTTLHTEVAELDLGDPKDSETVEKWLRGEDDDGAIDDIEGGGGIPNPRSAADPLPENASDIERLLHDKGKLSSLDYNVNIDWWKAGFAISLGVSLHSLSTGFKLFGMEYSEEKEEQTLTGDPKFAGAPREDGSRPWLPFTKCTQVHPV